MCIQNRLEVRVTLREVKKQMIDQPAHYLWMFATFFPLAFGLKNSAGLWIVLGLVLVFASAGTAIVREFDQWPSQRWWDPLLDYFFLLAGAVTPFIIWRT